MPFPYDFNITFEKYYTDELGRIILYPTLNYPIDEIGRSCFSKLEPCGETYLILRQPYTYSFIRTFDVSLGLINSLSKKLSFTSLFTPKLGIYSFKKIQLSKSLTTLLGLNSSYAKISKHYKTFITSLGIDSVREYQDHFYRTFNALLGLNAVYVKQLSYKRIFNPLLGLSSYKIAGSSRKLTSVIGLTTSFIKNITAYKQMSSIIGFKTSFIKRSEYIREFISPIGFNTFLSKLRPYFESFSTGIGFASDFSTKVYHSYSEVLSSIIGFSSSIYKNIYFNKSLSTKLGLNSNFIKQLSYKRVFNSLLGFNSYAFKKVSIILNTVIGFLAGDIIKRSNVIRSMLTVLGINSSYSKVRIFVEILETTLGFKGSFSLAYPPITFIRVLSTTIGLSATINKNIFILRNFETILGIDASSISYLVGTYGYKILKFLSRHATTLLFKDKDIIN